MLLAGPISRLHCLKFCRHTDMYDRTLQTVKDRADCACTVLHHATNVIFEISHWIIHVHVMSSPQASYCHCEIHANMPHRCGVTNEREYTSAPLLAITIDSSRPKYINIRQSHYSFIKTPLGACQSGSGCGMWLHIPFMPTTSSASAAWSSEQLRLSIGIDATNYQGVMLGKHQVVKLTSAIDPSAACVLAKVSYPLTGCLAHLRFDRCRSK